MADTDGILFLCVANSARSQMAEALARRMLGERREVFSAGSSPGRLHPFAVRVMQEAGVSMDGHYSKPVDAIPSDRVGTVINLCADEVCPAFLGRAAERLHWPFEDPAGAGGSDEEVLAAFRRVRDGIAAKLTEFLG